MGQENVKSVVDTATVNIGAALGHLAGRLDRWKKQRDDITAELQGFMARGRAMLADLSHAVLPTPDARPVRRGGRPKGYKMSPETRAKLRAAWKARKAVQAAPAKKRVISDAGRARIAAAQKKRWAKVKASTR